MTPAGRWRPRPEAGAGPRRRTVRLGVVLAVLGVLGVALAITAATAWRVPATATSSARIDGAAGAVVSAPGVLEGRDGAVTVTATGDGVVTAGVGSTGDVTAWLAADPPVPAARLTGFEGEDVVVEAPQVPAAAAPAPGAPEPSAAGSDLLVEQASGQGSVELTHRPSGSADLLLVTSDAGALEEVALTWSVLVAPRAAAPVGVVGGVLLLTGLVLLAAVRRGAGGPRLPRARSGRPPGGARTAGVQGSTMQGRAAQDPAPAGPAGRAGTRGAGARGATARGAGVRGAATRGTELREAVRAPALAVVAAAVLAGCGAPSPVLPPQPPAAAERGPAVTTAQLARIVDGPEGVAVTVAAADAALDPEALAARVDGAALAVRRADYTIAASTADPAGSADDPAAPGPLRAVGGERLLEAVPAAGPWPRFVLTVSSSGEQPQAGDAAGVLPTAPAAVPVLEVLAQADPRAPYKLVASAGLLPGATFPPLTQSAGAVEALAPDAGDVAVPPAQALAHLADLLTRGGASSSAGEFADSPFTTGVLAEQDAETAAGARYLTRTFTHTPREGAVWAVRARDGGAVVVGVLDAVRTFAAGTPGVSLTLPADVAGLAGSGTATGGSITAAETVVLTVPPAGSDQQVAVVGAQRAFTTVTLG